MICIGIINMLALRRFTNVRFVFGFIGLIVLSASLIVGFVQPAYASDAAIAPRYISADGTDLTAVVECLPKTLSQPNLALAIKESGNDFLQKVFDMKDDYNEYKVEPVEAEYLRCLQSKGATPVVMR
jgi:hypothetical protein